METISSGIRQGETILKSKTQQHRLNPVRILKIVLIFTIYTISANFGHRLSVPGTNVGLIWPPVGLMLGAMILLGYEIWPGILLGAFASNLPIFLKLHPPLTALAISSGQASADILQVVLSAWWLKRCGVGKRPLDRVRSVLMFIVGACLAAQAVGATLGTASLYLGGNLSLSAFGNIWFSWWMSNLVSVMILTPFILTWFQKASQTLTRRIFFQHLFTYPLIVIGAFLAFIQDYPQGHHFFEYFTIVFLVWAAFALGRHGATGVSLAIAVIAVGLTSLGLGPFAESIPANGILYLEVFLATFSGTGMLLSATLAERAAAEAQLRKLSGAVEHSPASIVITNVNGDIEYVNPKFTEITGYTAQEAAGQNPRILKSGITTQPEYKHLWDTILSGEEWQGEFCNRMKSGELYWESASISPVRDPSGRITHFVAVKEDVTARKLAQQTIARESALNASMARLTQKVLAADSLQQISELTLAEARKLTDSRLGFIGYINPNNGSLIMPALIQEKGDAQVTAGKPRVLKEFSGLWGWVLNHRQPLLNNQVDDDGFADTTPLGGTPIHRFLGVPGMHRQELVGQIALANADRDYCEHDLVAVQRLAAIFALGIRRRQAEENLERQVAHLGALNAIDQAILTGQDLRQTLSVFVGEVLEQLHVDAADVLLYNAFTYMLEYVAGQGFSSDGRRGEMLRIGEGLAGRAALEGRMLFIPDLAARQDDPQMQDFIAGERFGAYYGIPLQVKGELRGVLEIYLRRPFEPDAEWLSFMATLAGQAAISIDNWVLLDRLQRSNLELELAYDTTLEGWSRALDLRDKETEGHTRRVAEMTVQLSRAMNLSEEEVQYARRGALLHDIGKMAIPDAILLKPGALSQAEWAIMRKHPVYAYELLSPVQYLRPSLDIPYSHHERWNGSGYPLGLQGEQIPLTARIFAVIDVYDAMTSTRPYHPPRSLAETLGYINAQSGHHFDPHVVKAFLMVFGF